MPKQTSNLLAAFNEAYNKTSWHGPNLRGALRGVTLQQATWRPESGQHNIWEFALHCVYWKYIVRRRITGEKRGSFALKGSNFFARPVELTLAAWNTDLAILQASHAALRETIAHLRTPSTPQFRLIRGAAAHDLYHAGQIRLLKRLGPAGKGA